MDVDEGKIKFFKYMSCDTIWNDNNNPNVANIKYEPLPNYGMHPFSSQHQWNTSLCLYSI